MFFSERRHNAAVAIQVTPDDLFQNVFGQASEAGIVEQRSSAVLFGSSMSLGRNVYAGREHAARRARNFGAADSTADLILPAAAGGERLFEPQHVVE